MVLTSAAVSGGARRALALGVEGHADLPGQRVEDGARRGLHQLAGHLDPQLVALEEAVDALHQQESRGLARGLARASSVSGPRQQPLHALEQERRKLVQTSG